jgi:hypothetical protein
VDGGLQGETDEPVTTKVLLVTEAQQEFVFTEVPEKPVPSLLRNYSAPVKLKVGPHCMRAHTPLYMALKAFQSCRCSAFCGRYALACGTTC